MIKITLKYRLKGGELHKFSHSIEDTQEVNILFGNKIIGSFDPAHLEFINIEALKEQE
jgi:hypothetical protein